MGLREEFQRIRHILFRIKARFLYDSGISKILREIFWPEAKERDGLKVISCTTSDVFASHTLNNIRDEFMRKQYTWENDTWRNQSDTIFLAEGTIFVEPTLGLAFFSNRKCIRPTRCRAHAHLVPSLAKFILHRALGKKPTRYDTVIHFDGYVSRNLYHFFDDALNPLLLLFKSGLVDRATPILISERIFRLPYVQYVLNFPELKGLNWVLQKDDEWVQVKRLFKAVSGNLLWEDSYRLLEKYTDKKPFRKVFLNRTSFFQRRLNNNDVIEKILHDYGFETIYAENLTYEEQVKLFSETEYLVALHGAGITNLMYSDLKKAHLLEIFSKDLIHPHYYWFLEKIGIHYYDAIVGSEFDINWNYTIDEAAFKAQMARMMPR